MSGAKMALAAENARLREALGGLCNWDAAGSKPPPSVWAAARAAVAERSEEALISGILSASDQDILAQAEKDGIDPAAHQVVMLRLVEAAERIDTREEVEALAQRQRMLDGSYPSGPAAMLLRLLARAEAADRAEFVRGVREAADAVKHMPACPFDKPACTLEPEDPCPVCGDLGTFDMDAPSNCGTPRTAILALLAPAAIDEGTKR